MTDATDCNLYGDLLDYPTALQDDFIVQLFMERYPEAVPTGHGGIVETDPPQAHPSYTYHYGNGTSIMLDVHVRDCVDEIVMYGFILSGEDVGREKHPFWSPAEIPAFLAGLEPSPSYVERECWINSRGGFALVFPSSVDALVERGYLVEPFPHRLDTYTAGGRICAW